MEKYKLVEIIGQGRCTKVHKYLDLDNNSNVAMKWIPYDSKDDGLPCSILTEISVLKELDHVNVVRVLDVVAKDNGINLVFEHLDCDLARFIQEHDRVSPREIKSFLFQILEGVFYCHSHKVLHRDLNPHNLLIDKDSETVKLADFGLARTFDVPFLQYSTGVTTLQYRAPELLLGIPYSTAVDIWSVGCIFAEMVTRQPLLNGTTDQTIMTLMIRKFGLPKETDWPGVTQAMRKFFQMNTLQTRYQPRPSLPHIISGRLDKLKMLCMSPSQRINAHDALEHPYFQDLKDTSQL